MADTKAQPEAATTPVAPTNPNPVDDHGHHTHRNWWWFGAADTRHDVTTCEPRPHRPFDRAAVTFSGTPERSYEWAMMFRPQTRVLPLLLVLVWLTMVGMWSGFLAPFSPITINYTTAPTSTHRTVPTQAPTPDFSAEFEALNGRLDAIGSTVEGVKGQVSTIGGDVETLKARPAPPPPKKGLFEKK